ncbi:hypothetical protein PR048_023704 [Dryococelus australis]|uniref:Uncharacterized protein n=1 Tax=Dryococelus australis TaxID=614101 RepID=A0ABQ9GUS7_9NEOP|nr:hypothetical protein PR048_023704 [Dryococelus australis]
MRSRDPASPVKLPRKYRQVQEKIVRIMVSLPIELARECNVLNTQHCYVARSVTTVMHHERKVEAPVSISRAEIEIPRSTQIAALELLEKLDVLSCPCDVDEFVVSENMNQSGSLEEMKLCGRVVTDDSGLDLTGEDKQLLESLLQEYQHIFRERGNLSVTPLVQHRIYTGDHKPISMKPYRVPFNQQTLYKNSFSQDSSCHESQVTLLGLFVLLQPERILKLEISNIVFVWTTAL